MLYNSNLNWKTWLQHGDQYLKAATPKGEKSRLGADIRYNVLSMSLEGYIMAMLDYNGCLPENHTYIDLINALDRVYPLDKDLRSRILRYENIQSICSIEQYSRRAPSDEELTDLHGAISEIGSIAHGICVADESRNQRQQTVRV